MISENETASIRHLNDALRCWHVGGKVMMTVGIHALGKAYFAKLLTAVAAFSDFTPENDPYGEHDCAVMEVEGIQIIWKIDYYDRTMEGGSSDPSNPAVTTRVLTIMLAEEY